MSNRLKRAAVILMAAFLACAGCGKKDAANPKQDVTAGSVNSVGTVSADNTAGSDSGALSDSDTAGDANSSEGSGADGSVDEKDKDIAILFTSDVHCGMDQGFGYAGVEQIRAKYNDDGYITLLVDNGDAIQGEPVGTVSKGEAIIDLMNALHYDVAIPGNHEFDYGMEQFLGLTEKADFPYISCNFNKEGELVFDPYVIKEAGKYRIGFVGITTPCTLTSSTPRYFQDDDGNFIYGFMQDKSGEKLYEAVQSAVDSARAAGADYVIVMGHIGGEAEAEPYRYMDIIEHTSGIDVFLDGHSHDRDQASDFSADGKEVPRVACGTKLNGIGYVEISSKDGQIQTGVYKWDNDVSAQSLLGVDNDAVRAVREENDKLNDKLNEVVASTSVKLTINDPEEVDDEGKPVRLVRRAETNMGDLCADAYREQAGSDIAFVNGGGVRAEINEGDVTLGDILKVHPYGNYLCMVNVTGQQILDALEWGARKTPGETGAFLQVSGLTYEVDTDIESSCKEDDNGLFVKVAGKYRVKNVKVGDEPLDLKKKYTLASHNYMLKNCGDGFSMFEDCELLLDEVMLDNQVLINYITETLGGVVGEEYSDPRGQGRIVLLSKEEDDQTQ
ncbi:MAG: bifunctional metallophosphatase/5'-nucleotidase [Lachnospiraceae bacterium]|nr:bifunctional metallophosphatase/5'-nucleotidase [Lachnospiraceae bacterium]